MIYVLFKTSGNHGWTKLEFKGDNWEKRGESFFITTQDGKIVAQVPVENVLVISKSENLIA